MGRKEFYQTKEWKAVRKVILIKQGGLCARCKKRPAYHVHHKIHLTDLNYKDPMISLHEDNLEGLCKECHNDEHHPSGSIRRDVSFDENGDMIQKFELT